MEQRGERSEQYKLLNTIIMTYRIADGFAVWGSQRAFKKKKVNELPS